MMTKATQETTTTSGEALSAPTEGADDRGSNYPHRVRARV